MKNARPFFKKNPDKDLANGPNNEEAIDLINRILVCKGVWSVKYDENDEDALFIYVEENVDPQLIIEITNAHPDECMWEKCPEDCSFEDDYIIRVWWD